MKIFQWIQKLFRDTQTQDMMIPKPAYTYTGKLAKIFENV